MEEDYLPNVLGSRGSELYILASPLYRETSTVIASGSATKLLELAEKYLAKLPRVTGEGSMLGRDDDGAVLPLVSDPDLCSRVGLVPVDLGQLMDFNQSLQDVIRILRGK